MLRFPKRLLLLACAALALGACAGRDELAQDFGADGLYERGFEAMQSGNYPGAIIFFQQLEARYPFSTQTRQAQLDLIYLYYRSRQPELAVDAAEEFERENPTHPRVDYTLYMRGLIYFDQAPNILERLFRVDLTVRPPKDTMRSFSMFSELIRRFPESQYAADAQRRMVYLRNRLATYENHVSKYYMRRGAYVAAVKRSQYALEHYPGAPELQETLQLMIEAYRRLGMSDLQADAERVLMETFGVTADPPRLD